MNNLATYEPAPSNQGVQSYSSVTGQTEHVIFCVGQDFDTIQRFRRYAELSHLPYKELEGSYDGKEEVSFIVSAANFERYHIDRWVRLEESILLLGKADSQSRRPATLQYISGKPSIDLGLFKSVPKAIALAQPGWTHDPTTGEYYTTQAKGKTFKGMMY